MSKLKYNYKEGETPIERLRNKIQAIFGTISLAEVQDCNPMLQESAKKSANVLEDIKILLDDAELLINTEEDERPWL
tara:strand:+ start:587 stop:817 length:231 start_codon:yes stop_codon:yes gene_type:complete